MFAEPQPAFPARLAPRRSSFTSFAYVASSKSFALNLFADPHPLNPVASIFYKTMGGGGARGSSTFGCSDLRTFQPVS